MRVLLFVLVVVALAIVGVESRSPFRPIKPILRSKPTHQTQLKKPAQLNTRPIIGIMSLANSDSPEETGSMIPASYVKWLEQAGARVAVIPFNAPHDVLDALFNGINGILYTGGGLSLDPDTLFFQQALYLFNKARAANDAGDVFPLWGSCQGFQMMNLLAAQPANHESVLKCDIYNSTNLVLPLNFTDAAPSSYMFAPATIMPAAIDQVALHPTIYETLATKAITQNLHNCGISPSDFAKDPVLPSFYKVLSTNNDLNGRPFVSGIEGIKYPFAATQWHAERTQFEWALSEDLVHTAESIACHSYMAQRWMTWARQSSHRFPTEKDAEATLIYNYTPIYNGNNTHDSYPSRQVYKFDFQF